MTKVVIFNLGPGNLLKGFPFLTAQLQEERNFRTWSLKGSLPPAPKILEAYKRWQLLYELLYQNRPFRQPPTDDEIEIDEGDVTNVSDADFYKVCKELEKEINVWLDFEDFRKIDRQLRKQLSPDDQIRIVIQTEDNQVRKLPWHLWQFFQDYRFAEVSLSAVQFQPNSPKPATKKVRVLAILGDSTGINVDADRRLLQNLPNGETVFLVQPNRQELNEYLWSPQGWKILFFAGHSVSQEDGEKGYIYINPNESLTIEQLKNALKKAIERGLQLAIFNSCDGLGLAHELADLYIPQMIVMREPVPDFVAQEFLKNFITAFSRGECFYLSVREAREKLQGIESNYPGASWLPVIVSNPAEKPISWKPTPEEIKDNKRKTLFKNVIVASIISTCFVMGLRALKALEFVEMQAFDYLMQKRRPEMIDPRLLVVEITDEDTKKYSYPVADETLAQLFKKLQQYQPRAIGLDLHRYEPRKKGRKDFIAQFKQHQNIFTVCNSKNSNLAPPPEFSAQQISNQVGFSDLQLDDKINNDQTVRRQHLSYSLNRSSDVSSCTTPFSFSFQLAYQFLLAEKKPLTLTKDKKAWQSNNVIFKPLPARFGGYQSLDGYSNQILINYRSPWRGQISKKLSLTQVLEEPLDSNLVKDKVVIIGGIVSIGKDDFDTPYGLMAGVWIHAHQVSQILSASLDNRPLLWVLPQWGFFQWGDMLMVWFCGLTGGLIAWRCRSVWQVIFFTGVAILILHESCSFMLEKGCWLPLIPSTLSLFATSGFVVYNGYQKQQY